MRRQAVTVAGESGPLPQLTGMRVERKDKGGAFTPVVSLHLPSGMDSLRSIVELYNVPQDEIVEVNLRLLQFESDTTRASPPFWLAPTRGSLVFQGVDLKHVDTLQVSRRQIENIEKEAIVEFVLPPLLPGVYRIELEASVFNRLEGTGKKLLRQERSISVKSPTFPQIAMLTELVAALKYISFENEVRFILSAHSSVEMNRRFDAFWASIMPNRQAAANLMKLYYGRVEEANLYFTTFKEGWKTDRGMVYIILGAPVYVENRLDGEIWHYSFSDQDPVNTYFFERVAHSEAEYIFENYVLQRRSYYERYWLRSVDRWRDGVVL